MIYFGTDPEFGILDPSGKPTSAHLYYPHKTGKIDVEMDGAIYRDGYMLELEVAPSECRRILLSRLSRVLQAAKSMLPAGFTLTTCPALPVDLKYMEDKKLPPDLLSFGCEPSINAYTMDAKAPSLHAIEHPWRYAGGHMHFGWHSDWANFRWFSDSIENQVDFVKMLDLYLGVPLARIFHHKNQWRRREWYGRAGEFRFQDYGNKWCGVEYRSPSPEIFNNYGIASWAFGIGRWILGNFTVARDVRSKVPDEAVIAAINKGKINDGLLMEVPLFYNPQVVRNLAEMGGINTFELLTNPYIFNGRTELGCTEWRAEHHI